MLLAPGAQAQTRIVGGSTTNTAEWPWQVFLLDTTNNGLCGGSLVDPDTVLTAAHCADDGVVPGDLTAYLGVDQYPTLNAGAEPHAVAEIALASLWGAPGNTVNAHDWALLRLTSPSAKTPI